VTRDEAYAEVVRITRSEARNFAWGIRLLPRGKREAVSALYAFARRVDDIADDAALPPEERRVRLNACLASLEAPPAEDPVLVAVADVIEVHGVRKDDLADLVRGGLMDVDRSRYGSWEQLRMYCDLVAGSVGVACVAVYDPREPEKARPLAGTLGLALQQINIMRDVPEDWRLGRVYLPQDELARFGVTEEDIAAGRTGPAWRALMEHQAERADALLAQGLGLLPLLDRRSRLGVRSFAGVYRGLLSQMRSSGYEVFTRRPSLSGFAKLRAIVGLR
jgi:phytoene synthase